MVDMMYDMLWGTLLTGAVYEIAENEDVALSVLTRNTSVETRRGLHPSSARTHDLFDQDGICKTLGRILYDRWVFGCLHAVATNALCTGNGALAMSLFNKSNCIVQTGDCVEATPGELLVIMVPICEKAMELRQAILFWTNIASKSSMLMRWMPIEVFWFYL